MPCLAHSSAKHLRHLDDARLRYDVGRRSGRNAEPEYGSDIHDGAGLPGVAPAPRRDGRREPDATQVRGDDAVEFLQRRVDRGTVSGDARIVDEDVEGSSEAGERRFDGRFFSNIEGDGVRFLGPSAAKVFHKGLQPVDATRRHGHGGAATGGEAGEVFAQASRCAGHKKVPAFKTRSEIHAFPSRGRRGLGLGHAAGIGGDNDPQSLAAPAHRHLPQVPLEPELRGGERRF